MKTIKIIVTDEELITFAKSRGFKETLQQYVDNEVVEIPQDVNTYTQSIIETIIKNDSIEYIQREIEKQARESISNVIESIKGKPFNITIE